MLKIEVILGENDVMAISEALKNIGIGGLTVSKVRGRGKDQVQKSTPPKAVRSLFHNLVRSTLLRQSSLSLKKMK